MDNHDSAYRLLFSHAEMVRDLLLGFVPEPWVAELDLDSLERVNANYVSDDLRNRCDDVVWRVRWRSPVSLDALYPPLPQGLARWLPALDYLLIDEGSYADADLRPLRNLVAALFRLENSRSPADVRVVLRSLLEWLQSPEQAGLRRNLTAWLKRVLLPRRLPGTMMPEMNDLQEVQSMLSERVKSWTAEWLEQGRQEGRHLGEFALLQRQLARRFGSLSECHLQRLRDASTDQLEEWGERLLDATSIEELFGDPPHGAN